MTDWTKDDCKALFDKIDLFKTIPADQRQNLSQNSEIKIYSKGDTIIHRGDTGNSLFIVAKGKVRITLEAPKGDQDVSVIEEEDFFGEIGLMTHARRTANATADEDSILLEISADLIMPLTEKHPDFKSTIARTGAARSQDSLKKMLGD